MPIVAVKIRGQSGFFLAENEKSNSEGMRFGWSSGTLTTRTQAFSRKRLYSSPEQLGHSTFSLPYSYKCKRTLIFSFKEWGMMTPRRKGRKGLA